MSKFQCHKDAPDEVWLQIGYGDEGEHTWAPHQVAEDDIEQAGPYVRADRLSGRVRQWQPIETAPKDREFLAYWPGLHNDDWEVVRTWWDAENQTFETPHESLEHDHPQAPTHWQPLMPLPGETPAVEPAPTPDAREKALREAAAKVKEKSDSARIKLSRCYDEGEPESAQAWSAIISHLDIAHDAILALIPTGGGDD